MTKKLHKMARRVTAPQSSQITLPERVCMDMARMHPGCFQLMERVRLAPEGYGLPGKWSPWCFSPVNVMAGVLSEIHKAEYSPLEIEQIFGKSTRLASACAGWRMTKSVYVFDETILRSLVDSEAKDGIPDELFLRLPDWCPYIATPGLEIMEGVVIHGFFVSVDDHNYASSRHFPPELDFNLLVDPKLSSNAAVTLAAMQTPSGMGEVMSSLRDGKGSCNAAEALRHREYLPMHFCVELGLGSFASGVNEAFKRGFSASTSDTSETIDSEVPMTPERAAYMSLRGLNKSIAAGIPDLEAQLARQSTMALRLASIVLYLCSEEPDVAPQGFKRSRQDAMDEERRLKRAFQAKQIRQWDVGHRIGAEIRRWDLSAGDGADGEPGTGSRLRPHVRRAHWHTFIAGPRNDPANQIRRVKWLPPIPVNTERSDDLVPTVKPVHS